MNKIDRDALYAAAEKATPGPWRALDDEVTDKDTLLIADCFQNHQANAQFIALANPAAIFTLLDENEKMWEALTQALFAIDFAIAPPHNMAGYDRLDAIRIKARTALEPGA